MAHNASTNNGYTPTKDALTVSNVGDEVERLLAGINVNGFIKDPSSTTKAATSTSKQPPTAPISEKLDASQPDPRQPKTSPKADIPLVTSVFSDFIGQASPSLLTPTLRGKVKEVLLDYVGVTAAGATIAPSSEPILNGILAFSGAKSLDTNHATPKSGCTVITRGSSHTPPIAALLNATYGHSLDFDDTHATSSLHAGVTAIPTVLAEYEHQILHPDTPRQAPTEDDLLVAISIAYELTIRIGCALSPHSYPRGFHATSVAGIFGAVGALSYLRRLKPDIINHAFGLAGSKAAGSMQYLSNGSHNKRLHPGFACHDAFMCVCLAEAGVVGAEKAIEGELGLIQGHTERKREEVDWTGMVRNLGERWECEDSALKPYAGCRMTHGFIEMANHLGKLLREGNWTNLGVSKNGVEGVQKVRCIMPKENMILVGQRQAKKMKPENVVDAQFSCYYQVANAVLYGGTHDMAAYDEARLSDPEIHKLCQRVECVVDEGMRGMSCKMDVFLQNEDREVVEVVRREMQEPLGEVSHPFTRELVEEKFLGLMRPVYGEGRSREVMKLIEGLGGHGEMAGVAGGRVVKLMRLLARVQES